MTKVKTTLVWVTHRCVCGVADPKEATTHTCG